MARRAITSMDMTGPFFTRDPAKTFRQNARVMLARVAEEGEKDVKAQLASHRKSGKTAAGIQGRTKSTSGRQWAVTAVVSQTRVFPWKVHRTGRAQAQYRGGKLEAKTHAFRRTTNRLRRSRKINAAELLRGIA